MLLAVSFDVNLGGLISIPVIITIAGVIWIWLKKQISPLVIEVGKISATVEQSVTSRFTAVNEAISTNQMAVMLELNAIKVQTTATNGRVTVLEPKVGSLEAEVLRHALVLERLQGREDAKRELASNPAQAGPPPAAGQVQS